ncbi:MAG TPA: ABC transporter permease [bacterium]|nr:ABC transporter permease [bacterium]
MFISRALEALGGFFTAGVREIGEFLIFFRSSFAWLFARPFRRDVFFRQLEFIGVRSLPIIALTGTFTGMVFGLQTGYAFRTFNAQIFVGSTVGLALTREIGPVFTALMVAARAGSAMAAEIGTMKVTEQVDALSAMAVNPLHYLVVPRVVAATIMLPLLAGIFSLIGVVGAYFVAVHLLHIGPTVFMQKLTYYVDADDVIGGLIKAAIFGGVLGLISCQRGYRTSGGAEGVGRSTTQAVVASSVAILVLDYFLTSWILELFPGNG